MDFIVGTEMENSSPSLRFQIIWEQIETSLALKRGDLSTAEMVLGLRAVTVGVGIAGYLSIGVASILLLTSAAIHTDLGPSQKPRPVYRALDVTTQALFFLEHVFSSELPW